MALRVLCCVAMAAGLLTAVAAAADEKKESSVLSFKANDIAGQEVALEKYKGKVLLIVNVASRCGYTKQYAGLQQLHEKFAQKGLAVLGFPCNQFGGQEPGSAEEIKQFCTSKFGVTFDLFSKIDVNGPQAAPLYKHLTSDAVPVDDKGPIKWNFEKFLVGKEGKVLARYRSKATPEQIGADIERELAKP